MIFEIPASTFRQGLFSNLPYLSITISLFLLFISKLLYFFGIRPSYSGSSEAWTLLRTCVGIVFFLPGFFHLAYYFKRTIAHAIIAVLFMLPFMIGPSNDGYFIPLMPLIYYHMCLTYMKVGRFFQQKFGKVSA